MLSVYSPELFPIRPQSRSLFFNKKYIDLYKKMGFMLHNALT